MRVLFTNRVSIDVTLGEIETMSPAARHSLIELAAGLEKVPGVSPCGERSYGVPRPDRVIMMYGPLSFGPEASATPAPAPAPSPRAG